MRLSVIRRHDCQSASAKYGSATSAQVDTTSMMCKSLQESKNIPGWRGYTYLQLVLSYAARTAINKLHSPSPLGGEFAHTPDEATPLIASCVRCTSDGTTSTVEPSTAVWHAWHNNRAHRRPMRLRWSLLQTSFNCRFTCEGTTWQTWKSMVRSSLPS